MISILKNLRLKQRLHQVPKEDISTKVGGVETDLTDLLSLEEEDMRLQYKHLNVH